MRLSIIIPVYNEVKTVGKVIRSINETKLPKNITKEIIVVDDGSTDKTTEVLSKLQKKHSFVKDNNLEFKVLRHNQNKGKGAAVRTGIENSKGELIIIQDADLEYDPSYYLPLLRPVMQKEANVVYGTRLLTYPLKLWGRDKTVLPMHLIANKFLTFLTNVLYRSKLTDMETGYKLFKRDILKKIIINSNKFDFEAEITARILKRKIPITEIPISVTPRTYKQGKKIGWWDGIMAIWTLIKYKFVD